MKTRVAINGLGRIGRAILKLVIDDPSLELVAVNDLGADRAVVGAIERWGGEHRRPRCELSWRRGPPHLLRELPDELRRAARRDHWPPHRAREGSDDHRARLYLVPVHCRRTPPARSARACWGRGPRPSTSGAAFATTRALPQYADHFDAVAIRAPIEIGSIADITFLTSRKTSTDEVNQNFRRRSRKRALRRPAGSVT